jgi:hypothetical protein
VKGADGRREEEVNGAKGRLGYYVVRLVNLRKVNAAGERVERIASVRALDMTDAIAAAMRRYPGYLAVHGERH